MQKSARIALGLKVLLLLTLTFAFLYITSGMLIAGAEGSKARFVADSFWYDAALEMAILEGNAVLTYGDLRIEADTIRYSVESGRVEAEGNVLLAKGGNRFYGPSLTYEIKTEQGVILEVRGRFTSENIWGYIYSSSREVTLDGERITMEESHFTTCDLSKPHYLLRTARVVIVPGEYMTLYHVSFWELSGRLPLFYWPRLTIPLREDEDDSSFAPSIGYSQTRGFYIKTVNSYFWRGDQHGKLYLDYYSRTGFGGGVKHYYLDQAGAEGYIYFYGQEDRAGLNIFPRYELELSYSREWFAWTLDALANYTQPFSGGDAAGINLKVEHSGNSKYLAVDLESAWNEGTGTAEDLLKITAGIEYNQRLNQDWRLTANLYREYLKDSQEKNRLDGEINLNYSGRVMDFGLKIEKNDPKLGAGEEMEFARLPEARLTLYPGNLDTAWRNFLRPFTLNFLGGYYIEGSSGQKLWKGEAEVNYFKYYRPTGNLTLNLDQSLALAAYAREPLSAYGYTRLVYTGGVRGSYIFNPDLYASVSYNLREKAGESPFNFDRLDEQNGLAGRLNYNFRLGEIRGYYRLTTGYDFRQNSYHNLNNYLTLTGGRNWNLSLAFAYSLNNSSWEKLYATWEYARPGLEWKSGMSIDPEEFKPVKWDNQLIWEITDNLDLEFRSSYNFDSQEFVKTEAVLKWDLHCRSLNFSYDHARREFWVVYQIKAFPGQSVGLGTSEDDEFLFNVDLGDILNNE